MILLRKKEKKKENKKFDISNYYQFFMFSSYWYKAIM